MATKFLWHGCMYDLTTERHKLHGPFVCLASVSTCYPWVLVQPGIVRRPVDWCKNQISVLCHRNTLRSIHRKSEDYMSKKCINLIPFSNVLNKKSYSFEWCATFRRLIKLIQNKLN